MTVILRHQPIVSLLISQLRMNEKLNLKHFRLNDGFYMPLIGYGTYRINGDALIEQVIDYALSAGYRLFDTAIAYSNEESIGRALVKLLPKHKLKREDVFITSKLPLTTGGDMNETMHIIKSSLISLQLNYIDLYLIHWPGQQGKPPNADDNAIVRDRIWQALVEAKNRDWLRSIGVSNYTPRHLKELIANCHGVLPAVNQVEWHPLWHQADLKNLCDKHGILLQAYFSLGGTGGQSLLHEPKVMEISKSLSQSPASILLAWAVQQGVAVIPKSLSEEHIRNNFNITFELSEYDMKLLNNLPQKRLAGDPTVVT